MKILTDFLALILFFGAYWYTKDIRTATEVAMVVGLVQAAYLWWRYKKLEPLQWLSLGLILIFGGATVLLHNNDFIKWKPTVLYWLFALLIGGGLVLKKNPLKEVLGQELELPEQVWLRISIAWMVFFVVLGVLNLLVAFGIPAPSAQIRDERWATFKVFGTFGLIAAFSVAQAFYLSKFVQKDASKPPSDLDAPK